VTDSLDPKAREALTRFRDGIGREIRNAHFETSREVGAAAYLQNRFRPDTHVYPESSFAASYLTVAVLVDEILASESPPTIVELGSGMSTVWMALALLERGDGYLISVEHDAGYTDMIQETLEPHGVQRFVQVVQAPLTDINLEMGTFPWYDVSTIYAQTPHTIDLLFIDGPPASTSISARYPAVPILAERLSPGGIVVLDDYVREEEQRVQEMWLDIASFNRRVTSMRQVSRSLFIKLVD